MSAYRIIRGDSLWQPQDTRKSPEIQHLNSHVCIHKHIHTHIQNRCTRQKSFLQYVYTILAPLYLSACCIYMYKTMRLSTVVTTLQYNSLACAYSSFFFFKWRAFRGRNGVKVDSHYALRWSSVHPLGQTPLLAREKKFSGGCLCGYLFFFFF